MSSTTIAVCICYHSVKGHTAVIAGEIARGAARGGSAVGQLIDVGDPAVPWDDLFASDAIVFGCPTHFGSVSAPMKAFLDSTDTFWREMRWRDKIAAGFTCAGEPSGDKQSVLMTFCTFAMQHGMIWVGIDPMNDVRTGEGKPLGYNSQGAYQGAMADSDGKGVTAESPPASDRLTAQMFGARVARAALRWKLGARMAADA